MLLFYRFEYEHTAHQCILEIGDRGFFFRDVGQCVRRGIGIV